MAVGIRVVTVCLHSNSRVTQEIYTHVTHEAIVKKIGRASCRERV